VSRTRPWGLATLAVLAGLAGGPTAAYAGSTEPQFALAAAGTSVHAGVVTIEATGNFDFGNYQRLGYPIELVVTQGATVARLNLDGTVTLAEGGPATPLSGAPGIVAITPDTLTGVLPPELGTAGSALVRLEATFDGQVLGSNTVPVQW
jgi:hypothetical protein